MSGYHSVLKYHPHFGYVLHKTIVPDRQPAKNAGNGRLAEQEKEEKGTEGNTKEPGGVGL